MYVEDVDVVADLLLLGSSLLGTLLRSSSSGLVGSHLLLVTLLLNSSLLFPLALVLHGGPFNSSSLKNGNIMS